MLLEPRIERTATYKKGGHCLVCGFCLSPWTGDEVDATHRAHAFCMSSGYQMPLAHRLSYARMPGRCLSSFAPCDIGAQTLCVTHFGPYDRED